MACTGTSNGVVERRGHTEAAVDLARISGLHPSGVICEILNDDGTMARVPDLTYFCKIHDLKMITVADLTRYRLKSDNGGLCEAIEGLDPAVNRQDHGTDDFRSPC